MNFEISLKELLSGKYDPTEDSPLRFQEAYEQLVKHRNFLREKYNAYNAKEQRRADFKQAEASAAASEVKGSRYSPLPDDDDGSTTMTPSTKHKFAVPLTTAQLAGLAKENRNAEVNKIKKDITTLDKEEAKRKKKTEGNAVGAEQNEAVDREGTKKEKRQDRSKA